MSRLFQVVRSSLSLPPLRRGVHPLNISFSYLVVLLFLLLLFALLFVRFLITTSTKLTTFAIWATLCPVVGDNNSRITKLCCCLIDDNKNNNNNFKIKCANLSYKELCKGDNNSTITCTASNSPLSPKRLVFETVKITNENNEKNDND